MPNALVKVKVMLKCRFCNAEHKIRFVAATVGLLRSKQIQITVHICVCAVTFVLAGEL